MTYQYTDEQLNELNRDKNVYSVNEAFARKNRRQLITDSPNPNPAPDDLEETNTLTVGDQQFQVIATESDPETGFDGMAVAPIVNGKPDYSSVAVIAAGTDPESEENRPPLGIVSRDVASAIEARQDFLSPQYPVLDKFIQEIQKDSRYKIIQLSGYSQSSYVHKAGAKYQIPTTTFNAWFKYGSLTGEEWTFIQENPGLFRDYRKRSDDVVVYNDFNNPKFYGSNGLNHIVWFDGSSHKIEDWYFDPKTGIVLDKKGGKPIRSATGDLVVKNYVDMQSYHGLKAKWKKSGGKLSSSEKIFLDAIQAQMLGANMAASARSGADEASLLQTKAIQEVQDVWNKIDFSSYTELTPWEVEAAFASHGVTRDFVNEFQTESQEMVEKMMASAERFDTLKTQLDQAIASLQETDSQLAGDFKAWEQGM